MPRMASSNNLIIFIAGELIPFLLSSYLLITLSDVFVPILGRSGSEKNANIFFGVITSAIVIVLIWNGIAFIFVQFRKRILWTSLLISFFVINTLLVFGFIGKIPYQEKTPMRLNIVDVNRTWLEPDGVTVKTESGYWLWPYDSNTKDFIPRLEKFVLELDKVEKLTLDYNNCESLYCAQPFIWPMAKSIEIPHWFPHNISSNCSKTPVTWTTTVNDRESGDGSKSVSFSISQAPTQFSLALSPGPNYQLVNWSLTNKLPESGPAWKERNTYFIYHGRGLQEQVINFSCDFEEVGGGSNEDDDVIATVQLSAFYLYGIALMTDEFRDMVTRLPSWTYTMPCAAEVIIKYIEYYFFENETDTQFKNWFVP